MSLVAPRQTIDADGDGWHRLGRLEPVIEERADGVRLVSVRQTIGAYPRALPDRLVHWAAAAPDRIFLAERTADGAWRSLTYAETLRQVRRLAAGLLRHDLSAERPVAILSGNGIDHALVALAAMMVGVPYAPISPPYSLVARDFGKLAYCLDLLTPGLIFVADAHPFRAALAAVAGQDRVLVAAQRAETGGALPLTELEGEAGDSRVDAAFAGIGPDTIAKFLLTSGSTGEPKAVINTQRMLMANQAMLEQCFPFLTATPPVFVDWLPWNHTFGSNHNFGMVLNHGGTLHIDEGKPVAAGILPTVRNLRDIAPTAYFNVPKGYEALLPHLQADTAFARHFFSRLDMLFYAGAGLAQPVWDGYRDLAREVAGRDIPFVTGLGATETAPSALMNLRTTGQAGAIGLPMAGVTMKLVPVDTKLEARVKAETVTPGYWRRPDLTEKVFDEEGFYRFGDAVAFADPADPAQGFLFDGRLSEDFKLGTGTWVSVGPLRHLISSSLDPLIRDTVITGHDRDEIGVLLVPDREACAAFTGLPPGDAGLYAHAGLVAEITRRLAILAAAATGSSNRVARAMILAVPPSLEDGELTDKGSINQRAVLTRRADLVAALHAERPPASVIALNYRAGVAP
ncbi:MAG: feruloyl-CoA synthase [Phreatobacter sp.]|uniref:feruloyl-CoA synthase n=1 Tax=Phreatobacter sp. TaxID=1966341 RepID=UPI002734F563|nr:feruloyl-CoA synthase [Phreatobacter sp.]MDP2803801.1 feruloyl-CoA synthase [Phreatobacter sp.]